jgi:hypothetical protein
MRIGVAVTCELLCESSWPREGQWLIYRLSLFAIAGMGGERLGDAW